MIANTKNDEYPDGNTGEAWAKVMKKCKPKSMPTLIKMKKRFFLLYRNNSLNASLE